jgi:hypothetical protein
MRHSYFGGASGISLEVGHFNKLMCSLCKTIRAVELNYRLKLICKVTTLLLKHLYHIGAVLIKCVGVQLLAFEAVCFDRARGKSACLSAA